MLQSPPPSVIFKDFGESSLDFALRIWTRSLWACDDLQSDIRFSIDREFRAQNVEILSHKEICIFAADGPGKVILERLIKPLE